MLIAIKRVGHELCGMKRQVAFIPFCPPSLGFFLTRVRRARLPWDFVLFAFTTFTRGVVESHQSKVKQPCSLMCVEELFCPLATHFSRVLLKYVRKYCVTS